MTKIGRPAVPYPRLRTILVRLSETEYGALRRALATENPGTQHPTPAAWVRDLVVAHAAEVLRVDVTRSGVRHQAGGVADFKRWAIAKAVRRAASRRRRRT